MMRKGDLREYPVEWILRAAADERLSGGIEFHADTVTCVHLDDGNVYLASAEGDEVPGLADDVDDDAVAAEEERCRAATVAVVRGLLAVDEGWYFFHPLHDHPLRGEWKWEVDAVLADARPRPSAVPPLEAPDAPEPTPAPAAAPAPARPLTDDEWTVVQALAGPADRAELAARLGWAPDRLAAALATLTPPTQAPPAPDAALASSGPDTVPAPPASPGSAAPAPRPPASPLPTRARPSADPTPAEVDSAADGTGRGLGRLRLRSPRPAG